MTLLGYARVSTLDKQDVALQVDALHAAGCTEVHEERASGGRWDRPVLHRVLAALRPGDVLVIWKLDRLSRSLRDMLTIFETVQAKGAGVRSLTESIDTTTAAGRMLMQMLGAFAEYERAMVRERINAGLAAAKKRGQKFGRPFKLTHAQQQEVVAMLRAGRTQADVARLLGVHQATIWRVTKLAEARTA